MACIDMREVAHSYLPKAQKLEQYALKRIHMTWKDGGAYALLDPPVVAKPPCLTSSPACSNQARARWCTTAAT